MVYPKTFRCFFGYLQPYSCFRKVIGSELIYGRLFDKISSNRIEDILFCHLIINPDRLDAN